MGPLGCTTRAHSLRLRGSHSCSWGRAAKPALEGMPPRARVLSTDRRSRHHEADRRQAHSVRAVWGGGGGGGGSGLWGGGASGGRPQGGGGGNALGLARGGCRARSGLGSTKAAGGSAGAGGHGAARKSGGKCENGAVRWREAARGWPAGASPRRRFAGVVVRNAWGGRRAVGGGGASNFGDHVVVRPSRKATTARLGRGQPHFPRSSPGRGGWGRPAEPEVVHALGWRKLADWVREWHDYHRDRGARRLASDIVAVQVVGKALPRVPSDRSGSTRVGGDRVSAGGGGGWGAGGSGGEGGGGEGRGGRGGGGWGGGVAGGSGEGGGG